MEVNLEEQSRQILQHNQMIVDRLKQEKDELMKILQQQFDYYQLLQQQPSALDRVVEYESVGTQK